MRAALLAFAAALAGCASTELTPAGAQVAIDRAPRAGCRLVGALRGSAGYNGRSGDENAAAVERWLRNEAALRGGNAVVITSRRTGAITSDSLSEPRGATSGGCPNCVDVTANAYACPAAASTATAIASAAPAASSDAAPSFQADAAAAALTAAGESAKRCADASSPRGEARVAITFARSGEPVYVEVEGAPFAGTAIGECIARKFRNARVPAFSGDARSLTTTVHLTP